MLTDRCEGCPRIEAGLPECLGQHCPDYCTMAREGHADFITLLLAWQPMEVVEARPETAAATRPSVAESLSVLERMKACPHRTDETGCGCGGMARCALGKGRDGLVNHADCFACLQAPSLVRG
jgi:hypothetical protein